MGDHRSIILCFSTIDYAAVPPGDGGRERCEQILRLWSGEMSSDGQWPAMISEGCTSDSIGGACECVMHMNSKYFSSDNFMQILQGLPWDRPKEVELFWKGEEDETYHRTSLFEWRHAHVDCPCVAPRPANDAAYVCNECGGRLPASFIPAHRTVRCEYCGGRGAHTSDCVTLRRDVP